MRMIKLADRYYNDFAINKIAILKSSPGTPFVLGGGYRNEIHPVIKRQSAFCG